MTNLRGKWTVPGSPLPSSHLITTYVSWYQAWRGRCGVLLPGDPEGATPEPSGRGPTCENCLKWSRRDG